MTRKFRNRTFHIKVENPHHLNQGVAEIQVNQVNLSGSLIEPEHYAKDEDIEVLVTMG